MMLISGTLQTVIAPGHSVFFKATEVYVMVASSVVYCYESPNDLTNQPDSVGSGGW